MSSLSMSDGHKGNGRGIRPLVPVMGFHRQIPPSETAHDSPGGDVMRRHPNLPDPVFRRLLRDAATRETAYTAERKRIAETHTTKER